MQATTTLRLRRIKYKDGRTLTVLRPIDTDFPKIRDYIIKRVREMIDAQGDVVGFAFVAWGANGQSVADVRCGPGSFPTIYAPDFVRNRLLAKKIEQWTMENFE